MFQDSIEETENLSQGPLRQATSYAPDLNMLLTRNKCTVYPQCLV